jgi:predicted dienelactone hydrolase
LSSAAASPGWRARLTAAGGLTGVMLAVVALAAACAGQPQRHAARPGPEATRATPPSGAPATPGIAGSYRVARRRMTFLEPAHTGPAGQPLGQRTLVTIIRYPLTRRPVTPRPARGPLPLLMFAPGFLQCAGPYAGPLRAWASAGYVVAAVNFPRTDCRAGAAASEQDLVNQPADMSYVISRLLTLSARPHDLLTGLLSHSEIAATGQSDGGDTVAALAASTCCADRRLAAVAVLAGAQWPPMPGRYFARRTPPMLFVQGSADTINPPLESRQLYRADSPRERYYLDLFGANHMVPFVGTGAVERMVARVTLAFFDRYVLGQPGALTAMTREGNVRGKAALVSGGRLPP